jgi:hypothetical protein
MRWSVKKKYIGMTRIKSGFLLFPKCIEGEWRWLEFAVWRQKYISYWTYCDWHNLEWVNNNNRRSV